MPRRNHKPERTCLGCGRSDAKASMMRLALREGRVVPDAEGRAFGRGGYLHRGDECVGKFSASKMKQIRSLRIRLDRTDRLRISEEVRRLLDRAGEVE